MVSGGLRGAVRGARGGRTGTGGDRGKAGGHGKARGGPSRQHVAGGGRERGPGPGPGVASLRGAAGLAAAGGAGRGLRAPKGGKSRRNRPSCPARGAGGPRVCGALPRLARRRALTMPPPLSPLFPCPRLGLGSAPQLAEGSSGRGCPRPAPGAAGAASTVSAGLRLQSWTWGGFSRALWELEIGGIETGVGPYRQLHNCPPKENTKTQQCNTRKSLYRALPHYLLPRRDIFTVFPCFGFLLPNNEIYTHRKNILFTLIFVPCHLGTYSAGQVKLRRNLSGLGTCRISGGRGGTILENRAKLGLLLLFFCLKVK